MKRNIHILYLFVFLIAGFTSCEMKDDLFGKKPSREDLPKELGLLDLKLDPQKEKTISGNTTKASDTDENLDVSDFSIKIIDENGEVVEEYASYADIKEVLLAVGKYQVIATKGELKDAAYDTPYYEGKDSCEITSQEVSSLVTPCVLKNKKITVAYTKEFLKRFNDDYEIVMTNGSGILTLNSNEEKKPFFKTTDQLDFVLHATTRSGLETQYFCDLYNDPKVKEYNNIVVWLDVAPDTIPTPNPTPNPDPMPDPDPDPDDPEEKPDILQRPVIKVDIQLVEREYTITIPSDFVSGDNGGGDNGGGDNSGGGDEKPASSIQWSGTNLDSPITLTEENASSVKVVVDMTMPTGVAEMNVTISSNHSKFMEAVADIGNPFDMLNLNDAQSALLSPVSEGQKTVRFDVSNFMPLLKNFEGTHKFKIYLKDKNGVSSSKTLTIIAK